MSGSFDTLAPVFINQTIEFPFGMAASEYALQARLQAKPEKVDEIDVLAAKHP